LTDTQLVFVNGKQTDTHCKFLHGYAVSFRVWFEGELDERNWVLGLWRDEKSQKYYRWYELLKYGWCISFRSHYNVVAEDDPYLPQFKQMNEDGVIQLRILDYIGCERFAEYLFNIINYLLTEETDGRVRATKVEVYEHERNSASYGE
jgi:6-pyruvoyltetrahydropterin/6-carboxytetrahydropterin synthase